MMQVLLLAGFALLEQPQGQPSAALRIAPAPNRYITDHFALRESVELAYVTTDADGGQTTLHLVDLTRAGRQVEIPFQTGRLEGVHWLGPGRVLVISRTGKREQIVGRVFAARGPEPAIVGPADHIGLGQFEEQAVIITHSQTRGMRRQHQLTALDLTKLEPQHSRSSVVNERGQLAVGDQQATLLWWGDNFTTAAVRHLGVYDQARDVRLPDRFGQIDLLTGKLLVDAAIEPSGFARLMSIQRLYPGRSVFVHPDTRSSKLLLIDGSHWRELKPERPLSSYDLGRTRSQELDSDRVLVSLTVDPSNPNAASRGRRDPDDIEFYSIDRPSGVMSRRLVLPGGYRRVTWSASAGCLALLRKHRTFAAGGVALEVYALPATSTRS